MLKQDGIKTPHQQVGKARSGEGMQGHNIAWDIGSTA